MRESPKSGLLTSVRGANKLEAIYGEKSPFLIRQLQKRKRQSEIVLLHEFPLDFVKFKARR